MDPRQSKYWANFMGNIGWIVEKVDDNFIYIKKIPGLPYSVVKIQRPNKNLNLKKIDLLAKKYKALFVNLEPHFEKFSEKDLKNNGYKKSNMFLSHTSTIRIDLTQSEKSLLKSFSENARRNIKKVQNSNIKIQKAELSNQKNDLEFKKFFELLKNLTTMKKFYIPKYEEFYKKMLSFKKTSVLFFAYLPRKGGKVGEDFPMFEAGQIRRDSTSFDVHEQNWTGDRRSAELGKQATPTERPCTLPIAAVWLAGFSKNECLYVQTGITKVGYQNLANYLIVWEALKYAKKQGYKVFDFEGIYDPRFPKERGSWKNFTEFKKRFHGNIIEYPNPYIKIYNPVFYIIYQISKILPA